MFFSLFLSAFSIFGIGKAAISEFYFANDFVAPETVIRFEAPQHIYVASDGSEEAREIERAIFISDANGTIKSISEAASIKDSNGYSLPIFEWAVLSIKVQLTNSPLQNSLQYPNPAIIYALDGQQSNSKILSVGIEPVRIELEHKITVLSPREMIKLGDFVDEWVGKSRAKMIEFQTPVTVAAGGAEQSRYNDFTLHGLGALLTKTNPTLLIFEPIITIYKDLGVGPHIYMNISGNENYRSPIKMQVDWGDRIVAMSKGYRIKNTSQPINYLISSVQNETNFHVKLTGDIPEVSQLLFRHNSMGGESLETIKGRTELIEHPLDFGGNLLKIEYNRGKEDHSHGFFALIEIRQNSSHLFIYLSLLFVIFNL